jgi:hypothetical protein
MARKYVLGDFSLKLGEAFGLNLLHIFHELSPECFAPTGLTGFWAIDLFLRFFMRVGFAIALLDRIMFVIVPF